MNLQELKTLMYDALYNVDAIPTEFEGQDARTVSSDAIRKSILDAMGAKDGKYTPKLLRNPQNKFLMFEIIETALQAAMRGNILTSQLEGFVTRKHINLGETKAFTFPDPSILTVSVHAAGHREIDRQRITNGRLDIEVDRKALALYTEWEPYLIGQYDFQDAINRIAVSIEHDTALQVSKVLREGINTIGATFRHRGAFDIVELQSMIRDIESLTGQRCTVFGTRVAMSKISLSLDHHLFTETMVNGIHANGFVTRVHGIQFAMLPDLRNPMREHNNFDLGYHFDDNFLLVAPSSMPLVYILREGDVEVYEEVNTQTLGRSDNQLSYGVAYREGVGMAIPTIYGSFYMDDSAAVGTPVYSGESRDIVRPQA